MALQTPISSFAGGALCALLAGAAQAQTAPSTAPADSTVEEIVVTGQQLANARAVDVKRSAVRILDAVSADDVGNLPDFNAGDALKRVPGVNVLTYQGEPRFVTIRGFNANYITNTIDGFQIASPDPDGRKLYTEVLPSNLAGRIEVLKSASPDAEGHAIGGTVDFISRDYASLGGARLLVSGRLGGYLQPSRVGGNTPSGQLDVVTGKRFGADDQFELVVSGSYWQRAMYIPSIEAGGQRYFFNANGTRNPTPYGGNGIGVPQERRWYIYDNERTRAGGSAKLTWRPTDTFKARLNTFYYGQRELSDRYEQTAQAQTNSAVSNQTANSGTLTNVAQNVQLGQFRFERQVYGANLINDFTLNDRSTLQVAAGWSGARLSNPQVWDNFRQAGLTFNYAEGDFPVFTAVSPNAANPATYPDILHREEKQTLGSDLYELRADYEFGGKNDPGFGFKAGAKWTRNQRDVAFSRVNYTGASLNLSQVLSMDSRCPFGCSGSDYFMMDKDKTNAAVAAQRSSLVGVLDGDASFGGTYGLREDVLAIYGLARYVADRWSVTGGLRGEATDIDSNGYRKVNGVFQPVTGSSDYKHLLPSVNFNYDLAEDLKLRLAYSRTLGRPLFSDEATRGEIYSDTGSQATLSRSNPDLQPRKADSFDASVEWYLDGGRGILSAGVFNKVIKGEIFTFGQLQTLTINGQSRQVLVTQARNADQDAKVRGVEFGFSKSFTFLPGVWSGLGMSANATFLKVDWPLTLADGATIQAKGLPEQAKAIGNAALLYDGGKLHARVAVNYTGELWDTRFPNLTSAAESYRNRYQPAITQVDLQIRYEVNDRLGVSLEAQNVTDAALYQNIGRDQEYRTATIDYAPAVFIGASYKW